VVQENSASAEESASASVEMKTQAIEMKYYIRQLDQQVRGSSGAVMQRTGQQPARAELGRTKKQRELPRKLM